MPKQTIELKIATIKGGMKYGEGSAVFEPSNLVLQTEVEGEVRDGEILINKVSLNELVKELRLATHVLLSQDDIKNY